jgi:hypothetical protein
MVAMRVDGRKKSQPANDPDGVKSVFVILDPVEIDPGMRVIPDWHGDLEGNAVLGLIDPVLRLIPFKLRLYTM